MVLNITKIETLFFSISKCDVYVEIKEDFIESLTTFNKCELNTHITSILKWLVNEKYS